MPQGYGRPTCPRYGIATGRESAARHSIGGGRAASGADARDGECGTRRSDRRAERAGGGQVDAAASTAAVAAGKRGDVRGVMWPSAVSVTASLQRAVGVLHRFVVPQCEQTPRLPASRFEICTTRTGFPSQRQGRRLRTPRKRATVAAEVAEEVAAGAMAATAAPTVRRTGTRDRVGKRDFCVQYRSETLKRCLAGRRSNKNITPHSLLSTICRMESALN
eukprot:3360536-Prymnesium_polylepis.1